MQAVEVIPYKTRRVEIVELVVGANGPVGRWAGGPVALLRFCDSEPEERSSRLAANGEQVASRAMMTLHDIPTTNNGLPDSQNRERQKQQSCRFLDFVLGQFPQHFATQHYCYQRNGP